MGARTSARHAALQLLYALDVANEPKDAVIRAFWRETPGDPEGRPYADLLIAGILEKKDVIDARIVAASENWRIERMTPVDRNLLRMATYELEFVSDVPRAVAIDEAVEIAKRFGTEESSKFINGVLEKIATDLNAT
jgi:transcription antitermination protein NusB